MKVGIMTWFFHNYGTALQVTALTERIRSLNHEAVVINYSLVRNYKRSRKDRIKRDGLMKFLVRGMLGRLRRILQGKYLKRILQSKYLKRILQSKYLKGYYPPERENRFYEFLDANISVTEKCDTQEELTKVAENFDAVVCGSDQIWSPLCFDSHYYLDFVQDKSKKLAYAPSIDTNHVRNNSLREQIIDLAGDFEYISVREKKSAEILSQWLNKNVKPVLDPTLLLNAADWEKYIPDSVSNYTHGGGGGHCVVYMLGYNKKYWAEIYSIAERLGLELKIIPMFAGDLNRKGCITYPVGPAEFLGLFKRARFVCTDSFHGMIFSIIFHVNFIEFERFRENDYSNQNFRIYNIAELLSLEDRISSGKVEDDVLMSAIDFQEVEAKLDALREDSLGWLKNVLASIESIRHKEV